MTRDLDPFRVFVLTDGNEPYTVKDVPHCG